MTPTLIVCGTRKTISILMPESENRSARAEQLIRLATQLAHSRTVGEIDLVVLVTQAWVSPARVAVYDTAVKGSQPLRSIGDQRS